MLPTFLGIGVAKCGTTWLHQLLASHPDVYLPRHRKEVRFFSNQYEKGIEWYEKLFPSDREAHKYKAVGEITPHYLYYEQCPKRIAEVKSITKLIAMFRNPVDRLYSHYRWAKQINDYRKSFEEFIEERPRAVGKGSYAEGLKRYFEYFSREQFLFLIYERAFADVNATKATIADFLGVDVARFPDEAGTRRVNKTVLPRFRKAYQGARWIGQQMRLLDLDWVNSTARRLGVERVFGTSRAKPTPMNPETRQRLTRLYAPEVEQLRSMLQFDLDCWEL